MATNIACLEGFTYDKGNEETRSSKGQSARSSSIIVCERFRDLETMMPLLLRKRLEVFVVLLPAIGNRYCFRENGLRS